MSERMSERKRCANSDNVSASRAGYIAPMRHFSTSVSLIVFPPWILVVTHACKGLCLVRAIRSTLACSLPRFWKRKTQTQTQTHTQAYQYLWVDTGWSHAGFSNVCLPPKFAANLKLNKMCQIIANFTGYAFIRYTCKDTGRVWMKGESTFPSWNSAHFREKLDPELKRVNKTFPLCSWFSFSTWKERVTSRGSKISYHNNSFCLNYTLTSLHTLSFSHAYAIQFKQKE
jgi:hypothetical protein